MLTFQEWMSRHNINKPKRSKKLNETAALDAKPDASKILYIGAILTKDSQKALWDFVSERVAVPADWKKFCHHMTIRFVDGKELPDLKLPVFGEDVGLVVTHIYADDKGVCVKVEPNTNKQELHMPPDQIPHVTVACAPGVSPVYSNSLLLTGTGMKIQDGSTLVLNAFTGIKEKGRSGVVPERDDAASEDFKST